MKRPTVRPCHAKCAQCLPAGLAERRRGRRWPCRAVPAAGDAWVPRAGGQACSPPVSPHAAGAQGGLSLGREAAPPSPACDSGRLARTLPRDVWQRKTQPAGSSWGSQTAPGRPSAEAAAGESPSAAFTQKFAEDVSLSEGSCCLLGFPPRCSSNPVFPARPGKTPN